MTHIGLWVTPNRLCTKPMLLSFWQSSQVNCPVPLLPRRRMRITITPAPTRASEYCSRSASQYALLFYVQVTDEETELNVPIMPISSAASPHGLLVPQLQGLCLILPAPEQSRGSENDCWVNAPKWICTLGALPIDLTRCVWLLQHRVGVSHLDGWAHNGLTLSAWQGQHIVATCLFL